MEISKAASELLGGQPGSLHTLQLAVEHGGPTMSSKPNGVTRRLVALVLMAAAGGATAQIVVKAVGPVTEVWAKDERYTRFHAYLASKFKDTPALEEFVSKEQWVTVVSTTRLLMMPGIHKGSADAEMKLQVGDIVEMSVGDFRKAESYAAFGRVTKLLCRRGDPGFDTCLAAHPAGTWDDRGEPVELKLRP
jgi:hypothetical protein